MWNDIRMHAVIDMVLWRCLIWMHNNNVIQLNQKRLLMRQGWQDGFMVDSGVFVGFDFWVSDSKSHGW